MTTNPVIKYLEEELASAQAGLKMRQEWVVDAQKLIDRLEACLAEARKTDPESLKEHRAQVAEWTKALEAIDG